MKVYSLLAGHDDGTIRTYFGVKHEGALWLVKDWLIDPATNKAKPERMIRVDSYQASPPGGKVDFVNILLPIAVVDGQNMPGYEVRNLPESPVVDRSDLFVLPVIP